MNYSVLILFSKRQSDVAKELFDRLISNGFDAKREERSLAAIMSNASLFSRKSNAVIFIIDTESILPLASFLHDSFSSKWKMNKTATFYFSLESEVYRENFIVDVAMPQLDFRISQLELTRKLQERKGLQSPNLTQELNLFNGIVDTLPNVISMLKQNEQVTIPIGDTRNEVREITEELINLRGLEKKKRKKRLLVIACTVMMVIFILGVTMLKPSEGEKVVEPSKPTCREYRLPNGYCIDDCKQPLPDSIRFQLFRECAVTGKVICDGDYCNQHLNLDDISIILSEGFALFDDHGRPTIIPPKALSRIIKKKALSKMGVTIGLDRRSGPVSTGKEVRFLYAQTGGWLTHISADQIIVAPQKASVYRLLSPGNDHGYLNEKSNLELLGAMPGSEEINHPIFGFTIQVFSFASKKRFWIQGGDTIALFRPDSNQWLAANETGNMVWKYGVSPSDSSKLVIEIYE